MALRSIIALMAVATASTAAAHKPPIPEPMTTTSVVVEAIVTVLCPVVGSRQPDGSDRVLEPELGTTKLKT